MKSNDIFGHSFQLGFNEKGNVQTTLTGGIVSFFLKIFIGGFLVRQTLLVLLNGDDNIVTSESKYEGDEIIDFKSGNLLPYYSFTLNGKHIDLKILEEYANVRFEITRKN